MAGRHGVEQGQRRAHSRVAARDRRTRLRRRDASRGLGLWVALWVVIAVVAVPAMGWSAYLLARGRGTALPVVALVAGACALLMVLLDVRARRRHRRELASAQDEAESEESAGSRRSHRA